MDAAKAEVLAITSTGHWTKIWSTLERVNKEIKRRARVVGIFPNPAAVIHPASDTGSIAAINSGE